MIYLILSILTTSGLFVLFKLFDRYKINTLAAVVVNYITASILGFCMNSYELTSPLTSQRWFILALILGLIFIAVFNLMAYTAQHIGVSVSSVANKMSLVIPFAIALYLYGQQFSFLKGTGIIIALAAVYFTSQRKASHDPVGTVHVSSSMRLLLPILLFVGSGILDACLNFCQLMYLGPDTFHIFSAVVFASAAALGFLYLLIKRPAIEKIGLTILGGFVLGVVNYMSIYSFLNALEMPNMPSSVLIPVNNIGVVACSALAALLIFKERFSMKNLIGLGLSIAAICLLNWN